MTVPERLAIHLCGSHKAGQRVNKIRGRASRNPEVSLNVLLLLLSKEDMLKLRY